MPNKSVAGTGALAFSSAITVLITAIWWPDANATIATAITTVIAMPLTWAAIYFTPHVP